MRQEDIEGLSGAPLVLALTGVKHPDKLDGYDYALGLLQDELLPNAKEEHYFRQSLSAYLEEETVS